MVKLTRIYTRGGDKGQTSLGRGERVPKHDLRVEAYGTVDEANSVIGIARAAIARTVKRDRQRSEVEAMLARIQNDLFDLGADLCTLMGKTKKNQPALRIVASQVERLEREIDAMNGQLQPLASFILRRAAGGAADDRACGQAGGQSGGDQVHQPPVRPLVRAGPKAQRERCFRCSVGTGRSAIVRLSC
jgi:cob(I)alamin adenosyltransferase